VEARVRDRDVWFVAIVGALLLYWLLGRRVNATVTVPQEEITVRVSGQGATFGVDPLVEWLEDI
jgi:hypothetical protein